MPGTIAPVMCYAKPAFFLQEVKKNDMNQEFIGKVNGVNAIRFKVSSYFGIVRNHFIQCFFGADKKVAVFAEKLFCNGFDIRGFFQLSKDWLMLVIHQDRHKTTLGSVAFFIFAN